jgi:hypothetical protein
LPATSCRDKPYITLHAEDIIHPLKEVDAASMAWAQTPEQLVEVLKYVTSNTYILKAFTSGVEACIKST